MRRYSTHHRIISRILEIDYSAATSGPVILIDCDEISLENYDPTPLVFINLVLLGKSSHVMNDLNVVPIRALYTRLFHLSRHYYSFR